VEGCLIIAGSAMGALSAGVAGFSPAAIVFYHIWLMAAAQRGAGGGALGAKTGEA
jgi:hypothetical protein